MTDDARIKDRSDTPKESGCPRNEIDESGKTNTDISIVTLTKTQIKSAIQFLGLDEHHPRLYMSSECKYFLGILEYRSMRKVFYAFKEFYSEDITTFNSEIPLGKFFRYLQAKMKEKGFKGTDHFTSEYNIAKLTPMFIKVRAVMTSMRRSSKLISLTDLGFVIIGLKQHEDIKGNLFDDREINKW